MFCYLNKAEKDQWLPLLFDLLYENMQKIAPSGRSYECEKVEWLAEVSSALEKEPRQIILCFVCGELAGYIQYYIREQMLMVEEIQLKKEFHRTLLFYKFCKYFFNILPDNLETIEAYADRRNQNSIQLMEKLGMQSCEPDTDATFVHLRGKVESFYQRFKDQGNYKGYVDG